MSVTELDIKQAVRRLSAVFNMSKPEAEVVSAWKWVLGDDLDPIELSKAVTEYAKSGARYFPTAGQIREAAIHARTATTVAPQRQNWNQTLDGPCPVCGAVLREITAAERGATQIWDRDERGVHGLRDRTPAELKQLDGYGVVHDSERHRIANEPIVGYAR